MDETNGLRASLGRILASDRKPTVPDVREIVHAYYELDGNVCGGSLHIVLDDGNVRDKDVEFCQKWAREHGDEIGAMLADVLAWMSRSQRWKLYRGH